MSDSDKINNLQKRKIRVLIAPLDWGLGHATRCLPIIYELLRKGCDVCVACSERQAHLMRTEVPDAQIIPLPGYNFRYSKLGALNKLATIFQVPKILIAIKREHRWLRDLLKKESFDLIISDNRYGFYNQTAYSVFITHQLQIQVPGNKWLQRILQKWNYYFINRFNECWIPDFKVEPSLAGELSHPEVLPKIVVRYIGLLSRFENIVVSKRKPVDILILISGPEPQRTILEEKIVDQLQKIKRSAIVVRGLPEMKDVRESFNNISFFNHLPAKELNELMSNAQVVISRSGYSTVMDIVKLGKKSILVPTPGQTEQEYLAAYLMQKKWCLSFPQNKFFLESALQEAAQFDYTFIARYEKIHLENSLGEVIDRLRNQRGNEQ